MELTERPQPRLHGRVVIALVALTATVIVGVFWSSGAHALAHDAGAQRGSLAELAQVSPVADPPATSAPSTPADPDGDEPVATSARTGPDPSGRAIPPQRQRIIDNAVWVWLLVVVAAAGALAVRSWWTMGGPDDSSEVGFARREVPPESTATSEAPDSGGSDEDPTGHQHPGAS